MTKLFKKIRRRLLTKNRFTDYLLYALGEILLVVIGIANACNRVNGFKEVKYI